MSSKAVPPSVPPSIPDQIKRLETAAAKLNAASDELSKPVDELNAVLKQLNVGVPSWYEFNGDFDGDTAYYWKQEIGYAKVGGEWGVSVRTRSGFADDPDREEEERWLFDDAPRALRLDAIDHLGNLLGAITAEAESTAEKLLAKVDSAKQVASAATASVTKRFDRPRRRK